MSDPMSNREIEDVLSSIRRLVAREAARSAPERPAPDRLVLTEAQRIAVNEAHPPKAGPGGFQPDAGAAASGVDAPVAAPSAAPPAPASWSENAANGGDEAGASPAAAGPGTDARIDARTGPGTGPRTAAEDAARQASTPAFDAVTSHDHATASRAPSRPAATGHEGHQAPLDTDENDGDTRQARSSWRATDDAKPPAAATGREVGSGEDQQAADPGGDRAGEGDAPGSALTRDQRAPDAGAVDVRGEAGGEPGSEAWLDDGGGDGDEYEADEDDAALAETLIDEEMLRALVAQLVREELRGQLGERITMQVRKLVRAEVARALDQREYL